MSEKIKAKRSKNAAQVRIFSKTGNCKSLTAITITVKAKTKSKIIPNMFLV